MTMLKFNQESDLSVLPISRIARSPVLEITQDQGTLRKVMLTWLDGAGTEHERAYYGDSAREIYAAAASASAISDAAYTGFLIGLALGCMLDGGR